MTRLLFFVFVMFSLKAMAISPTTHYVATTGDDDAGNGTEGSPWQTIQHAINTADAGDIIEVAGGTYTETLQVFKGITINGAAGTVVTPPPHVPPAPPSKVIDEPKPLLTIVSRLKDSDPVPSSSNRVTIRGIEFDCAFDEYTDIGIRIHWDDVVLDNVTVHSIGQTGRAVYGILADRPGSLTITNSLVYNIFSDQGTTKSSQAAKGICIKNDILLGPGKSDNGAYDIVISHNEVFNIASSYGDEIFSSEESSTGIYVVRVDNVWIHNNVIGGSFPTPDKDMMYYGPMMGVWLETLGGDNTVSENTIEGAFMGLFSLSTPYLTVEDNTIKSLFGMYVLSSQLGLSDKSTSPNARLSDVSMPAIKMPVANPSKSNKSFEGGNWAFVDNQFGGGMTKEISGFFGLMAVHNPYENSVIKVDPSLVVQLSDNTFQGLLFGAYLVNLGKGEYSVFDNDFTHNVHGLILENEEEGEMTTNIYDNGFVSNNLIGIGLENSGQVVAHVYQNLLQANGIGIEVRSGDFSSVFINNNTIVDNTEYGVGAFLHPEEVTKNDPALLDATCNWWGTIDPIAIQGMFGGYVEASPYLLTNVRDPADPAYNCGGLFALLPLSNGALVITLLLMTGFSLLLLRKRVAS